MRKVTAEKEGVNEGGGGKTSNIQHPTPNIEVGEAERLAFDNIRASQARADLIAFTKTFFGLDSECPSQPGNLSA